MSLTSSSKIFQHVATLISRYLWIVIWIVTLLSLFEVEIRSVGKADAMNPVNILPGFWLSDFGLTLPIIFALLSGGLIYFFGKRLFIYFLLTCCYGMFLFFVRSNSFDALGLDLRICLALMTGLSLVHIVPDDDKSVVSMLNIISLLSVIMAIYHLLSIPGLDLSYGERVTNDTANILISIPLILAAPIIIFSVLTKNKKNMIMVWATMLLFIFLVVVIMKTRSSFLALAWALLLSLTPWLYLSRKRMSMKMIRNTALICALTILILTVIFIDQRVNFEEFIERMTDTGEDFTSLWRKFEVLLVLETMTPADLLIGMGFNPPSPLFTVLEGGWAVAGVSYNSLHIGILNVWWRFGFIIFVAWMLMVLYLVVLWLKSLKRLKRSKNKINSGNPDLGMTVCAPGVFVLIFISLLSGGWSVHAFLALGMILGLYYKISKQKSCKVMMVSHGKPAD